MGVSTKDSRDEKTWVVFELTYLGEKTAVTGELEKHLKDLFEVKPEQVFIPYKTYLCDGRAVLLNVMEGYCFVEYTLNSHDYIRGARESSYLKGVLHSKSGYTYSLHTIPNSHVQELKEKLQEMAASSIVVGDRVIISKGVYEGLTGEVLSVDKDFACVVIRLRTLEAVRVFPKFMLTPEEQGEAYLGEVPDE